VFGKRKSEAYIKACPVTIVDCSISYVNGIIEYNLLDITVDKKNTSRASIFI